MMLDIFSMTYSNTPTLTKSSSNREFKKKIRLTICGINVNQRTRGRRNPKIFLMRQQR